MNSSIQTARPLAMQLLAGPSGTAAPAADTIAAAEAWPAVVDHCRHWNVLPALAAKIRAASLLLPQAQATTVAREAAVEILRTKFCLRAGAEALRLLAESGIPAVAFKGFAVIAALHRGDSERMVRDVDILIRPDTVPAALAVLESHGYRQAVGTGDLAEYIAFVQNSPGSAGNEAVSLTLRPTLICTGSSAGSTLQSCLPRPGRSTFLGATCRLPARRSACSCQCTMPCATTSFPTISPATCSTAQAGLHCSRKTRSSSPVRGNMPSVGASPIPSRR